MPVIQSYLRLSFMFLYALELFKKQRLSFVHVLQEQKERLELRLIFLHMPNCTSNTMPLLFPPVPAEEMLSDTQLNEVLRMVGQS